MILAAGLGTRLRPLTDRIPKALIEVGGVPMLERVARRLIEAGADRLIVNVHHLSEQVVRFIEEKDRFGVEVCVSVEPERRLETGGGLKHAAGCFRKDAPFFMHNADVLTDADLRALYAHQAASDALATLAVRPAETPRYLVQDAEGRIVGYGNADVGTEYLAVPPEGPTERVDFLGVHV
ncbi:MAG TPA: sugar phosphate nucleotidyltransferase, partial [Rhodothermales bacterium]|nr:sugar phosphate nucleotidyltransferase [Rhodothermales bacterium]